MINTTNNMKKKILLIAWCLLIQLGYAQAENVVSASPVLVPQGGEATVELACSFETTYIGFQLDMTLPEGLSLKLDGDSKPIATLGGTGTNHAFTNESLGGGVYRFMCTSLSNQTLPVTTVLMSFTIVADAGLTVGAEKTVNVSNLRFVHKDGETQTEQHLSAFSFTVTIDNPSDGRTILDETSTTVPENATGVDVRVKRTIKANEWSTICLPFSMTEAQVKAAFGDDVELAEFDDYDTTEEGNDVVGLSVNFNEVDVATYGFDANYPYLIRTSQAISEFTVDNVDIDSDEDEAKSEWNNGKTGNKKVIYGTFQGTYHAQTVVPNNCLFLSGNKFYYSTGATRMKAFRAYFDFPKVLASVESASAKIRFSIDDEATYIEGVGQNQVVDGVYSAQGLFIGNDVKLEQLPKGVYIVNGKKVVKK